MVILPPPPQHLGIRGESGGKKRRRIQPWWSVGLLVALLPLYVFRPDATFAVTVWPAWIGAGFGLTLTLLASRWRKVLCLLWVLFLIAFVDEARSLPRLALPAEKGDFRVVTLNCAGGSETAAKEVARLKPDLVLFQESPSASALERVARELFGAEAAVVHGIDASIIARGGLEEVSLPRGTSDFVAASWTHPSGRTIEVVSLRMLPPTMRIDLYNPAAWTDFASNRRARRQETVDMARAWASLGIQPDLVGGDFNTPPDRSILDPIVGSLDDAFSDAGVGLGATCVNPYPCLVRIDQIWSGRSVEAVRAWVEKTDASDHRMLVVDFRWASPR